MSKHNKAKYTVNPNPQAHNFRGLPKSLYLLLLQVGSVDRYFETVITTSLR